MNFRFIQTNGLFVTLGDSLRHGFVCVGTSEPSSSAQPAVSPVCSCRLMRLNLCLGAVVAVVTAKHHSEVVSTAADGVSLSMCMVLMRNDSRVSIVIEAVRACKSCHLVGTLSTTVMRTSLKKLNSYS